MRDIPTNWQKFLGGGSQTTLMAHLNDWDREFGKRQAAAETPLAGIPAEASPLLQQLWRAASEADAIHKEPGQSLHFADRHRRDCLEFAARNHTAPLNRVARV
jgi:hypothetical protein